MVVRIKKRSRKYLGSRRWGGGNIKNRRGSGSRGGVGRAGKKHKFTRIVVYEKERVRKKGFAPWRQVKVEAVNLDYVSKQAKGLKEVNLAGYKILSGGSASSGLKVTASAFSKKAAEKIKKAGGEAIQL